MLRIDTPVRAPDVVETFETTLHAEGLHRALGVLNRTVPYRFTGVYYFEPEWVRSLALFDRQNPQLQVGADVPMKESYCMFTARASDTVVIVDAPREPRWSGHAARDSVLSYVAVPLLDAQERPLGTLCHFDFCSQQVPAGAIELLGSVRELVQDDLMQRGIAAHPQTRFE